MQTMNLFGLTDEQKMMHESVLQLLAGVMTPEEIRAHDRDRAFPHKAYQALADAGWMALPYPEKFGGMGGSYNDLTVLVEAMSYHYSGLATAYLTTVVYGGMHVLHYAREELAQRVIGEIISGKARLSIAMTEPGTGSDVASIRTKAIRDGDDYVINGSKLYITCAHVADYIVLVTKTDATAGRKGITLFLIDAKAPGVTIRPLEMLGRRTTHANEVFLENVRTPASWMLGEENRGWHNLMRCLNLERLALAAVGSGNCFKVLDYTLAYARERTAFGQAIASFQITQHKLADMRMMAETARLHAHRVAQLLDAGEDALLETAMAKTIATDANFNCAHMGLQIMGGAGYTMEYDMQMFFRDSRVGPIGGGSNEIQRNIIAKRLGL
jgi:alkylation response protein AidB-like acyl-CoA dehydrogenase